MEGPRRGGPAVDAHPVFDRPGGFIVAVHKDCPGQYCLAVEWARRVRRGQQSDQPHSEAGYYKSPGVGWLSGYLVAGYARPDHTP
jgi:hypothetical protein